MSDRGPDEQQSRHSSPDEGRGAGNIAASSPLSHSYEPTELDASDAFARGMDAAGIRLANGRGAQADRPSDNAETPESFVQKILAERGTVPSAAGNAVSRLLAERTAPKTDKGFNTPS